MELPIVIEVVGRVSGNFAQALDLPMNTKPVCLAQKTIGYLRLWDVVWYPISAITASNIQ